MEDLSRISRRNFLAGCGGALLAGHAAAKSLDTRPALEHERAVRATPATRPGGRNTALIAITLDLEMSNHYPTWDRMHWDFEKGNLDEASKRYTVEVCRRVKARGGRVQCFVLGRTFEQEDVDWLKQIVAEGHSIGNHTYDHVNVRAASLWDIQSRFRREPRLIEGKRPEEVIRENIAQTTRVIQTRLGVRPSGFRTPGGFADGLTDYPKVQQMLLELGFKWASSRYSAQPIGRLAEQPGPEALDRIRSAQPKAQPFTYTSGLIEIPMSPLSDIHAFREARWKLPSFLQSIRRGVTWAIENHAVYDFIAHPSCLGVVDPAFKAVDLICDLVRKAGSAAELVDLDTIASTVSALP